MVQAPEAIPLDEAALLVAAEEYANLDINGYRARLDAMAAALAPRIARELEPRRIAGLLNAYLFGALHFRGNVEEYYDPRNSFLNEVMDRRVGIPITLSIIYIAVGGRLGLPLAGVSFPGHFIVTYRSTPTPLYLDPFNQGRFLQESDFRLFVLENYGPDASFDHRLLHSAAPKEIVARLLRNLKQIYIDRDDDARAIRCSERLLIVGGLPEERRDLGLLLSREGRLADAISALERYLREAPAARDRSEIEDYLARLRMALQALN